MDDVAAHGSTTSPVGLPAPGTRWIGTSWKMTKTRAEALSWARTLAGAAGDGRLAGVQAFVVPPATALAEVAAVLAAGAPQVLVGAQDAHWEDAGAWTGEVSVPQVADAGARLVELGHSERREHFGDTDARVAAKVRAVLRHGLVPLVCVGEDARVRESGDPAAHVRRQVGAVLDGLPQEQVRRVVLAYEPVWAIGSAGRQARPEEVAEVTGPLDAELRGRVAAVLYGGSVTPDGAGRLLDVPGVDGLFVGRAAWDVTGYLALVELVARA